MKHNVHVKYHSEAVLEEPEALLLFLDVIKGLPRLISTTPLYEYRWAA